VSSCPSGWSPSLVQLEDLLVAAALPERALGDVPEVVRGSDPPVAAPRRHAGRPARRPPRTELHVPEPVRGLALRGNLPTGAALRPDIDTSSGPRRLDRPARCRAQRCPQTWCSRPRWGHGRASSCWRSRPVAWPAAVTRSKHRHDERPGELLTRPPRAAPGTATRCRTAPRRSSTRTQIVNCSQASHTIHTEDREQLFDTDRSR